MKVKNFLIKMQLDIKMDEVFKININDKCADDLGDIFNKQLKIKLKKL